MTKLLPIHISRWADESTPRAIRPIIEMHTHSEPSHTFSHFLTRLGLQALLSACTIHLHFTCK